MPQASAMEEGFASAQETCDVHPLLDRLDASAAVFFPVRHHSPACAGHLKQLIHDLRPERILVEGPRNLTPLIPLLLHPRTRMPVAVYTHVVDAGHEILPAPPAALPSGGAPRFAAYYPFCDFSPELVALQAGAAVQARTEFIDLTYPEKLWAERGSLLEAAECHVDSLLDERHLERSAYLRHLARRTGCRNPDELWDHLFEVRSGAVSTREFMRRVAAYCCLARRDYAARELEQDGTLAREQAMAAAIAGALQETAARGTRRVLVVTGGFHTVALPALVQAAPAPPPMPRLKTVVQEPVLVRYSFDQLDSLNGYASGMPSPQYYQWLWSETCAQCPTPLDSAALRVIVEIGRTTRERKLPNALSPADEIAAFTQARLLARLRNHSGPAREDILDGIRSCFVKGSMDAEGEVVMGLARQILSGVAIGDVPPEAGVPPLVENFRQTATQLRLNIQDATRRNVSLDIYRKVAHRRVSRLLHTLTFLEAPFAALVGGPDFVSGTHLELLQEHWEYGWSPRTESALVEASVYGSTIEDAGANRLRAVIAAWPGEGKGRTAGAAVTLLARACRMGLHRHAADLLTLIRQNIEEDGEFLSVADAASQLVLLWQSREPLEAQRLPGIPDLLTLTYQRMCSLMDGLANCKPDAAVQALCGMGMARELLVAAKEWLDPDLFWEEMKRLLRMPQACTTILGGAAGLLYAEGRLPAAELLILVRGQLGAAVSDSRRKVGFVLGLFRTCREAAWQQQGIMETLNVVLDGWDEAEFMQLLPELRLTFADMTPAETDRVAAVVASLHGKSNLGELVHHDVTGQQVEFHGRITRHVIASLQDDGLVAWAEER
jgi:hypothetical protein